MVVTILRIGAKKALGLVPSRLCVIQAATLTGRGTRGGPLKLREGGFWDWEKKKIWWPQAYLDITKFHVTEENARLIVVDGPIAAGKTALAKAIAEEFDMRYFPDPTMDDYWITPYGYDLRNCDSQLPEHLQSWDEKTFCMDPKNHLKSIHFQKFMLVLRYIRHVDALTHILNTGQGAVLDRCYFSDRVFAHAMYDEGYLSKGAKEHYDEMVFDTHWTLMRPHVVIYLDVPVPLVQERIKARNISWEVNGKALTTSYLESLEKHYKQYLKELNSHADLLIYDWSEGGEVESVVEDLEELKFEEYKDALHPKYMDWKICRRDLREKRIEYTNRLHTELLPNFLSGGFDCDEIWFYPWDVDLKTDVFRSVKGNYYADGFNPSIGDKVLFKTRHHHRRPLFHSFTDDYMRD